MNRIQLCESPLATYKTKHQPRATDLPLKTSQQCEHGVFVPLHYEANYSYPVVVWLHGPGDDQGQLKRIMPLLSMRNYIGVSPCGTERLSADDVYTGHSWNQDAGSIMLAADRVNACIELAQSRFNVNTSRIFVAGYDTGGTMALRLAMSNPEMFAGAASIGGRFPSGLSPLLRIDHARKVPVFVAQGSESQSYSVNQVCSDLRLMHAAGISVALRQYPCDQEVTTTMLTDLNQWLMQIVTGTSSSEQSHTDCWHADEQN